METNLSMLKFTEVKTMQSFEKVKRVDHTEYFPHLRKAANLPCFGLELLERDELCSFICGYTAVTNHVPTVTCNRNYRIFIVKINLHPINLNTHL